MKFSIVAFVMLTLSATLAEAEPSPRKPVAQSALDHNARAARLFAAQSFAEAAAEYKASLLIEPAPITHLNLGQCIRILGEQAENAIERKRNFEAALWHYDRFFKTSPETPLLAEDVRTVTTEIRALLAAITIEQPRVDAPRVDRARASGWYEDGVGWALTGAGVVSGGVAVGLFVSASGLRDDAYLTPDQQEQNGLRDKADTRSLIGTTLAIVGGGLLASGVIKLALHSEKSDDREISSWSVSVSPSGFAVFGSF